MQHQAKINSTHTERSLLTTRESDLAVPSCFMTRAKWYIFRCLVLCTACLLVFKLGATAQPIPQAAIDELVKSYKTEGISLEKIYTPDFTMIYPNTGLRYVPCYPGKRLLVLVLMTEKPIQYVFKVKHGDNMVAATHEPESIVLAGKTYWFDYRATAFPPDFSDHSTDCLFVLVMDQRNHKMPIYTLLLTKPR